MKGKPERQTKAPRKIKGTISKIVNNTRSDISEKTKEKGEMSRLWKQRWKPELELEDVLPLGYYTVFRGDFQPLMIFDITRISTVFHISRQKRFQKFTKKGRIRFRK